MNWGRGLFRLWVILSGLWMALWATIVILDGHLLEAKKTYEVEGPSKEKYEVVAPPNVSEAEIVAFAQKSQRADCADGKTGPWCTYPVKLEMPRKPIEPVAIYLAIGVPLGALFIGSAFYWALSGFRRSK